MNEKITALYCRSATTEQDQSQEVGLDQKKKILFDYAKENSINTEVYEDSGYSGNSMDRPTLKKLIEDIKQDGVVSVIVTDNSQLSRKATDFDALISLFKEHDASFICLQN